MLKRLLIAMAGCVLMLAVLAQSGQGQAQPSSMYASVDERLGINAGGYIPLYDVAALGARWYMDWKVAVYPPHPQGMEFVQTVRTCHWDELPTPDLIARAVAANPSSLWLIGNEPDSIWNDSCSPDEYAQAYHEAYTLIKSLDPTAQVAAGGIVQATPLRMEYVDRILEAYQQSYGQPLPADAWHIHTFVLREEYGGWGASIPPGMPVVTGTLYDLRDVDDVDVVREQVVRFRQWMKAHGWQDLPLHVPEYGVLMPEDILDEDARGFDAVRVGAFMTATFDYFLQTTDPELGCPADENRLVQSWAWYSLQDDVYDDQGRLLATMFNGDLFTGSYFSHTLTPLGQVYAAYVAALPLTPYVDLWPHSLELDGASAWLGEEGSVTLLAQVANRGNTSSTLASSVGFAGSRGSLDPVGQLGTVPPRYQGMAVVTSTWTTWISSTAVVTLSVDPGGASADVNRDNNTRAFSLTFSGDAQPQSIGFNPPVPLLTGGQGVTVTALVWVANPGNVGVRGGVRARFHRQGALVQDVLCAGTLPAGGWASCQASWVETAPGAREIVVRVSSPVTGEKQISATLLVAAHQLFLPLVYRGF